MSFLSQAYLLDKYGPRLTMAELAEVLGVAHGTLRNRLSAGTLKCRTYYDGGTRYAAYRIRPASAPIARPATPIPPARRSRRLRRSGASEHPHDQVRDAPGPQVDEQPDH